MTGVRIVRLTADEADRLRRIRLAALTEAPEAFGSSYAETAARPLATWHKQLIDLATFLAVRDGRDIGMVRGAPSSEEPSAAELLSMWVEPSERGRGVGEALVRAVETWARDEGFSRLLLEVYAENVPARRLYARMGFVATGRHGGAEFALDLDPADD